MSRYLQSFKFETDFDGDHVLVTLKPLAQVDMLRWMAIPRHEDKVKGPDALPVLREIVPGYVEKLEGLADAAGSPICMEVVARDAYFTRLLIAIGHELVSRAAPADPTKPGEQPLPASPGPSSSTGTGAA